MIEQEIFHGRTILYVENFEGKSEDDFSAYYSACERLKEMGYSDGSMERSNPIGFYPKKNYASVHISKWSKLSKQHVEAMHGVLIAHNGDWRFGTVQILWWEYPVECPLGHIPWERLTVSEKV